MKGGITDDCTLQLCDSPGFYKNVCKLGIKSYLPFVGVITPGKEEVSDIFLFRQYGKTEVSWIE